MSIGPEQALAQLRVWSDAGWLRQLDSAFARFLWQLDPNTSVAVLMAAALLTHMEGRGHTCLPMETLQAPYRSDIDWPPAARQAWQACWQQWQALPAEQGLPTTPQAWAQALRTSPLVYCVTALQAINKGQPLVLGGSNEAPLLYLHRYWVYEQQVLVALQQRLQTTIAIDQAAAQRWLQHLFPTAPATPDASPLGPNWQQVACAIALRAPISIITGGPGTGKTYTAARLLALLLALHPQPATLRVALAAPTGKAAARLSESIASSLQELQQAIDRAVNALAPDKRPATVPDLAALIARIGKAKTVHALLGASLHTRQFRHHAAKPLDVDVLIVDETSMIHLEMMAALLQAVPTQAQLILLGDKDQLASVEAGAVLGDLCTHAEAGRYSLATQSYIEQLTGSSIPPDFCDPSPVAPALAQQTVMLRESRRFDGAIGALALAVNQGRRLSTYDDHSQQPYGGDVWIAHTVEERTPAQVATLAVQGRGPAPGYRAYLEAIRNVNAEIWQQPEQHQQWVVQVLLAFQRFRILCPVHEGAWGDEQLNPLVQKALQQAGLLRPQGEWFVGRPVMVTRNDASLGIFNGDVGVVLPSFANRHALRAYFLDGEQTRSVAVGRLAHVETAFVMTVHKSQGSEFEHTLLVLPDSGEQVLNRQLVYTGITRARSYFSLVEAKAGTLERAASTPLRRASGLAALLDATDPMPNRPNL